MDKQETANGVVGEQLHSYMKTVSESNSKTLQCPVCNSSLANKTSLASHMKFRHLKQFSHFCDICGRGFWKQLDLDGHVAARHTNVKQYYCGLCCRAFAYKSTFKRHMKKEHANSV